MSMGWMPLQAATGVAQNIGVGTNMMQQYTANRLANQAQAIQNQYQPNLLQNQVLNGQISNQYLPQMDQSQINYQNAMTQWMPMNSIARMMQGVGGLGRAQAYALMAQKNASPIVNSNGIAPGMVQGALNNANFLNYNPMMLMNMLRSSQNPMAAGGIMPPQSGMVQSQMANPNMAVAQAQPQNMGNMAPQNMAAMPPQNMGGMSPQMVGAGQNAPMTMGANGVPQGYLLKNGITGAYQDSNGNSIQPETTANQTFDQKSMAAIGRINDQLPALLKGAQFQNTPTDTKEMVQGWANHFGGNFQLPEDKADYESALQTIPESMLRAYGLQGTNELYNAMKESIEPKEGESPTEYQNRVYAQQYMFQNFAQQAGNRLSGGIPVGLSDYDPLNVKPNTVKINGTTLDQYISYANQNNLALPDVISTKYPPSEIQAYATKYKMSPGQVIQLVQQRQGAANAGS